MTDKQRQINELEKLLSLFETEGWLLLQQDITETYNSTLGAAPSSCVDSDKWQFTRGQLDALARMKNLEIYTRNVYDSLTEEYIEDTDADL
jgi:hypothetical protein